MLLLLLFSFRGAEGLNSITGGLEKHPPPPVSFELVIPPWSFASIELDQQGFQRCAEEGVVLLSYPAKCAWWGEVIPSQPRIRVFQFQPDLQP